MVNAEYIELPSNNLYVNGSLVTNEQNETYLERRTLRIAPHQEDRWHIVEHEDMLDGLAYRYYKQIIADASKLVSILYSIK